MAEKKEPARKKQQSLSAIGSMDLLSLILICGLLCFVFFWLDNESGSRTLVWNPQTQRYVMESKITWAPAASIWVCIIGFSIAAAHIIYHHAKRHGRNAVAWATAFIVFSPFLSLVVYLLSWPNNRQSTDLQSVPKESPKTVKKKRRRKSDS